MSRADPVLFTDGDGTFTAYSTKTLEPVASASHISVALSDINGDGKADIVSNGMNGDTHAYLSNGDGTFSNKYTTDDNVDADTIFLAELNGDGKADLVRYDSFGGAIYTYLSNV